MRIYYDRCIRYPTVNEHNWVKNKSKFLNYCRQLLATTLREKTLGGHIYFNLLIFSIYYTHTLLLGRIKYRSQSKISNLTYTS